MDIWKDIPNCNGYYKISNTGKIRSKERYIPHQGGKRLVKGRVMKLGTDKYGYNRLNLQQVDRRVTRFVHRLVAESFIPNPLNKPEVNHIDGNKLNNHIDNLEWVTSKENIQHAYKLGLMK